MTKEELMHRAIELSENSVRNGGGPFGAVIAKDGIIIAEASNSVTIDKDPTAHAEVNCVRQACFKLKTFNLEGCASAWPASPDRKCPWFYLSFFFSALVFCFVESPYFLAL